MKQHKGGYVIFTSTYRRTVYKLDIAIGLAFAASLESYDPVKLCLDRGNKSPLLLTTYRGGIPQ